MSNIQPKALTNSELERMVYIEGDKLPATFTEEIMKRFLDLDVKGVPVNTPDPKQLNLFD